MSYSRIPLTCQDFQLGFRTVNQSIENNNVMWQQLKAKHLTATRNYPGDSLIGRHDDYLVPRSVSCWFPDQNIDLSWFAAGTQPSFGPSFGSPQLRGTGRWRIQIYESSSLMVTGCPIENGGASIGKSVVTRLFLPAPSQGSYVDVTTWDITSGSEPAPAFFPFSLVLWARRY